MDLHCKVVLFEVRVECARGKDKATRHTKTKLEDAIEIMCFPTDELGKHCPIERNYVAGAVQRGRDSE